MRRFLRAWLFVATLSALAIALYSCASSPSELGSGVDASGASETSAPAPVQSGNLSPTQTGSLPALDDQSIGWFKSYCSNVEYVASIHAKMASSKDDVSVSGPLFELLISESRLAGKKVDRQRPPTFDGGQELAADGSSAFNRYVSSLEFANDLNATNPYSPELMGQLASQLGESIDQLRSIEGVGADTTLASSIQAQVPECANFRF